MPVQVVTDSTADLPRELVESERIAVVPLTVRFGTEEFRDGIDITPDVFLQKLESSAVLPTTAQPSPKAFEAVYQEVLRRGEGAVSIHISGKLSGTMNSARLARQELGDPKGIAIVDSQWTSMALGLIVLAAAREAARGTGRDEVVATARSAMRRVRLLLFVDTLEYLQRGGRIGKAQAFLGGLLSVKPLITLRDGEVYPEERVRTRSRALERLRAWAAGLGDIEEFCALHIDSPGDAEALKGHLQSRFPRASGHMTPVGPVIAAHVGPGAVGIAAVVREG